MAVVGVPLEMVHGATRIGLVYVAGVVAGRQVGPKFIGDTSPQWLGIPMGWGKSQASRRPRTFITEALTTSFSVQTISPSLLGS